MSKRRFEDIGGANEEVGFAVAEKKQKENDFSKYKEIHICDIGNHNDYLPRYLKIKVVALQCIKKSYRNNTKNLLEVVVLDGNGDKIKVIAWNEEAIKFAQWKKGDCFSIKNFRLVRNKAQYVIYNAKAITVDYNSIIEPLNERDVILLKKLNI